MPRAAYLVPETERPDHCQPSRRDALLLFAYSSVLASLIYWALPPSYNADSASYLDHALMLFDDGPYRKEDDFRTPGYPVLMYMTGVISSLTFRYLFCLQTLMGVLIPLLTYWTLLVIQRRLALWSALVIASTLIPYLHMKDVMTEQPYMFFELLAVAAASRYFACSSVKHLWLMTAALLAMHFLRPSSLLLFCVLFLGCVLRDRSKIIRVSCCLCAYLLSIFAWSHLRPVIVGRETCSVTGVILFSAICEPSATLQFMKGAEMESRRSAVEPQNGPFTRTLFEIIDEFYGEEKTAAIRQHTLPSHWADCWHAAYNRIGPKQANRLLQQSALETIWAKPYVLAVYWKNLIEFLIGFPPKTMFPHIPVDYRRWGYHTKIEELPSELQAELSVDHLSEPFQKHRDEICDKYYGLAYTVLKGFVFVLLLIMLPFMWNSEHRCLLMVFVATILYQAVIVSVFAQAEFRYHVPIMPIMMMSAFAGAHLANRGKSRDRSI